MPGYEWLLFQQNNRSGVNTMATKITWTPNYFVLISNFIINKSTDMGVTFNFLANVTFNTAAGAPNYIPATKQFFYTDSAGNPGYMYQIISVGANGSSVPMLVVAPPNTPTLCTVFGYLVDGFGNPGTANVFVRSIGSKGERWAKSPPGLNAFNPMALGVVAASAEVFPDTNGVWQVSLVCGSYACVSIPAMNFSWCFEVPSVPGPINIRDIPTLRGEALGLFGPEYGESVVYPQS